MIKSYKFVPKLTLFGSLSIKLGLNLCIIVIVSNFRFFVLLHYTSKTLSNYIIAILVLLFGRFTLKNMLIIAAKKFIYLDDVAITGKIFQNKML